MNVPSTYMVASLLNDWSTWRTARAYELLTVPQTDVVVGVFSLFEQIGLLSVALFPRDCTEAADAWKSGREAKISDAASGIHIYRVL